MAHLISLVFCLTSQRVLGLVGFQRLRIKSNPLVTPTFNRSTPGGFRVLVFVTPEVLKNNVMVAKRTEPPGKG